MQSSDDLLDKLHQILALRDVNLLTQYKQLAEMISQTNIVDISLSKRKVCKNPSILHSVFAFWGQECSYLNNIPEYAKFLLPENRYGFMGRPKL